MPPHGAAYSINRGLWGVSIGGKETLTSQGSLPDDAWVLSRDAFTEPLPPRRSRRRLPLQPRTTRSSLRACRSSAPSNRRSSVASVTCTISRDAGGSGSTKTTATTRRRRSRPASSHP
ncbi:MAG: hypothetical protein EBS39_12870 [Gammaproteobacteria bacterium]|nr:hypothetical protein [Gammaproteobacteria bacterium]